LAYITVARLHVVVMLPLYQTGCWRRHCVLRLSVHYPFITKLVNVILMTVDTSFPRPMAWNGQIWGSGGERSRSRDAEDRFGGL